MKKFTSALLVIIIAVLLALGILGGILVIEADAAQDYPLKIWKQNENGRYQTLELVDEDTGVNYIVVAAIAPHGDHTTCVSITPRLNADGSLYIDK